MPELSELKKTFFQDTIVGVSTPEPDQSADPELDLNQMNAEIWVKDGFRSPEQRRLLLAEFYLGETAVGGAQDAKPPLRLTS